MNSKTAFELRKILFLNGKPISDFDFSVEKIVIHNNYCIAYNEKHFEIYNAIGKCILSKDFKNVKRLTSGTFRVTENSLTGIYNYDGTIILPIEFDQVFYEIPRFNENSRPDIFENCYIVKKRINNDIMEGLYSSDGKVIIPPEYYFISSNFTSDCFHDVHIYTNLGHVLYRVARRHGNNNLYGFFTSDGKMIVPCEYSRVNYIKKNNIELAVVTDIMEHKGVYSITGELIIPIEFDDISSYLDDRIFCLKKEPFKYSCFSLKTFSWI